MVTPSQIPDDVFSATLAINNSLILATQNANKIAALKEALRHVPVEIKTARDFNLESPEETGSTILENALIKARAVSKQCGRPAISDDSGFCISELHDLPGAAAIDWAGPNGDYNIAIKRIGGMLSDKGISTSAVRFVTCIALALPEGAAIAEEGVTNGELVWPPRGETEGYLSIFALPGDLQTLAEKMAGKSPGATHRLSAYRHRAPTVRRLMARVNLSDNTE